jgi:HK97 family phage major capsid protein
MILYSLLSVFVVGAVGAAYGYAPAETNHTLQCCVDWFTAATAHTDGIMLASGAAAAAGVKEQVEQVQQNLKKILDPDDGLMAQLKEVRNYQADIKQKVANRSLENAEYVEEVHKAIMDHKLKERLQTMQDELHERLDEIEKLGGVTPGKAQSIRKQIGDKFVKQFQDTRNPVQESWKVNLDGMMLKDITNAAGSAGPAIIEQQRDDIIDIALRQVTVFDLLQSIPVSTDTVDYVVEKAVTDNAGAQPGQGATVSFSDWTFEEKSDKIETIMMKVRAAQQVLEDEQRLEAFVQTKMRQRLLLEAERQVVVGDGTGNNLLGLVPQSTSYDTNLESAVVQGTTTDLDRIKVAILQTQRSELPATGIIMPHLNWTSIQLLKDSQGRYIFVQPQNDSTPRLWGLPVNATNVLPEGSAHVGNYQLGATFYDRQDVEVMISTEDEDNFQKLMATFRATMRGQVAVERPKALITLPSSTLDADAPSSGS